MRIINYYGAMNWLTPQKQILLHLLTITKHEPARQLILGKLAEASVK